MKYVKLYTPIVFLSSLFLSLFFYETAKAWLSISMFGVLGSVILFNSPIFLWTNFYKNTALVVFSVVFFSLFLFFLNTQNYTYAINRAEIKIPVFAMAFAFAAIGRIQTRIYFGLLIGFVGLCFFSAIYTIIKYVISYDVITENYLKAKVMPSIINHVRYSIVIAMGAYISYYIYAYVTFWKANIKYLFLIVALILFVFLHIYSVRSGLIAIYGAIFIEIVIYAYRTKRVLTFFFIVAGLSVFLFTSITFIPSLHNKWINTKMDILTYLNGGYPNYNSLTTRLISYDAAISIFKKNPLMGCGIGDIKGESDLYFQQHYPMIDIPILPHNQFLFYLAATGIVGLFLFCFCFYFPLFYNKNWRNKILLIHYVILTLSFMTEPMLETQLGVAFSLLFILLPLSQETEVMH